MSVPPRPLVLVESIFQDDPLAPVRNGYSVEVIYRSVDEEEAEPISNTNPSTSNKRKSISLHCDVEKSQGNSLFIFGGAKNKQFFNSVHFYGVEQRVWEEVTDMTDAPEPRAWQRSAMIPERNSIIIFGGYNGKVQQSDLYEFHLDTKKWTKLLLENSDLRPIGRNDPSLCVRRVGSKIQLIIIGGYNNTDRHLNDMWVFDFDTNSWSSLPCKQPIKPRSGHCAEYLKEHDTILLYGGFGDGNFYGDVLEYDFKEYSWKCIKHTGIYIRGHSMKQSLIDTNVFVIVGGKNDFKSVSNTMYLFFYFEKLFVPVYRIHVETGIRPIRREMKPIENHHCTIMYNKNKSHTPFLLFGGTNEVHVNQLLKVSFFHGEFLFVSTLKKLQGLPNSFADVQFVFEEMKSEEDSSENEERKEPGSPNPNKKKRAFSSKKSNEDLRNKRQKV